MPQPVDIITFGNRKSFIPLCVIWCVCIHILASLLAVSHNPIYTLPQEIGNLSHLIDLQNEFTSLAIDQLMLPVQGNLVTSLPQEIGNLQCLSQMNGATSFTCFLKLASFWQSVGNIAFANWKPLTSHTARWLVTWNTTLFHIIHYYSFF